MSITSDCMVVNLQIGLWLGYRLDKAASAKVTSDAGAQADVARVNKHLIPKEDLAKVVGAANAIRTHFYTKTLPWKDNGDRVLTRTMYQPFVIEHEKLVKLFETEVENFLGLKYLVARERASFRMGALFNANDYPPVRDLQRRFYVNLDIDAVSEASDFRVDLDDKERDRIKRQMENAMRARLGRAMQDVWQRLAETLGHFAGKMSGDEIFRDSTVHNLQEICDLLPGLNILEDANLDKIRRDIQDKLVGFAPKDLRKNKQIRASVAGEAKKIMDDMAGFMNAFGKAAE